MAINSNQFVTIQGWMGKEGLCLKGSHLLVYAIIYGFSQDGVTACRCHLSYFMEWADISERTARAIISELIDADYITRTSLGAGRGALIEYRANLEKAHQAQKGVKFAPIDKGAKIAKKGAKISQEGGKNCRASYIDNIIIYNNIFFDNTREALNEKREKEIYKLFFFKNVEDPMAEAREFIRVNELFDWKDSKGRQMDSTLKKLLAWADGWKIAYGTNRINPYFLNLIREIHNEALRLGDPMAYAWMDRRISCESDEHMVFLYVSQSLMMWIENQIKTKNNRYYDLLRRFLKGRDLKYKTFND